jgi:quinol-cytochrome oxidoreductase complex cytochrome b subunit
MFRVYFTGAYRHPRQINWLIGFMLLFVTLTFGFTGYSLVFEQMSFWGATVATNLTEAVPLVGPTSHTLRGGPVIGDNTLTRFFILHIGVLPHWLSSYRTSYPFNPPSRCYGITL